MDQYDTIYDEIRNSISKPALIEQFAEECTELAHALLKLARIIRGENPTPVTANEAWKNVVEEYGDVELCASILDLETDFSLMEAKELRWLNRLHNKEE